MDSAGRKRRWVERMRNEDGVDPDSPRRTPVQIYLSDDARAVFGQMRALAKQLERPSISNSELVEQLLLALKQRRFQLEQIGCSADDVIQRYAHLKAEIALLRTQLRLLREEPVRIGKRSLRQVLEKMETPPSREMIALEIKRAHNTVSAGALATLARDLAPLLVSAATDPETHAKLGRRIEAYLERLFDLRDASNR